MKAPDYSFTDRMVHRLAFGTGLVQQLLCDIELQIYAEQIQGRELINPIFVTGLPRVGTTLILDILSRHPDAVTHSYRDMPFVLSPLIWRKMMGRFRVSLEARERAHGDGMVVDADSPEAFEEVLWLKHFPDYYAESGIRLWDKVEPAFVSEFQMHIRRLAASRHQDAASPCRYVSKNNANIARLPALRSIFPDAHVLVPLRHPVDHASSLLQQHLNFLDMHGENDFSRQYMADIGHFEFGALHRPIMFDGMQDVISAYEPTTLNYWLGYWIAAHKHLSGFGDIQIIDMERFTAGSAVESLFCDLGLGHHSDAIRKGEAQVNPMKKYHPGEDVEDSLLSSALELFAEMRIHPELA